MSVFGRKRAPHRQHAKLPVVEYSCKRCGYVMQRRRQPYSCEQCGSPYWNRHLTPQLEAEVERMHRERYPIPSEQGASAQSLLEQARERMLATLTKPN